MKFIKFKKKNKKGFTLIELLAVITIMGILMVVAIPATNAVIKRTKKSVFVDNVKNLINSARTTTAQDSIELSGNGFVEYTLEELGSTDPNLQGKIIGKMANGKIEFFSLVFDKKNKLLLGSASAQGLTYYEEDKIEVPYVQTAQNINLESSSINSILSNSNYNKTIYLADNDEENVDIYTKNKEGKYEKDILPLYYGGVLDVTPYIDSNNKYYKYFYIFDQTSTTVELVMTKFSPIYDFERELSEFKWLLSESILKIRNFTCNDLYKVDFGIEFQRTPSYDNACDYYSDNDFKTSNLLSTLYITKNTKGIYYRDYGPIQSQVIFKEENTRYNDYNTTDNYVIKYGDTKLSKDYFIYTSYYKYVIEIEKKDMKCLENGECYINENLGKNL